MNMGLLLAENYECGFTTSIVVLRTMNVGLLPQL